MDSHVLLSSWRRNRTDLQGGGLGTGSVLTVTFKPGLHHPLPVKFNLWEAVAPRARLLSSHPFFTPGKSTVLFSFE